MALVSPGVEVQVIDESFYTPAAASTVPMIFVASASNKTRGSGSGIAQGTLQANAGKPYLITSQRELSETFGTPLFYSDNIGNMIHGYELNEYGLQTAYSILGVTNRAYVARADLDLAKLDPQSTAPGGEPVDGAYWFDTAVTNFGVLEWNSAPATTTGGQSFTSVTPLVLTELSQVTGDELAPGAPKTSIGAVGDYAVVAITTLNTLWYKNQSGTWVTAGSETWAASWPTVTGTTSNPTLTTGETIVINSTSVILSGTSIPALASSIISSSIPGISAAAVDGSLEIYSTGVDVVLAAGTGTLLTAAGLTAGTYAAPELAIQPHTQVPEFKIRDTTPKPSGSLWIKTTQPNGGANFRVKTYNSDTQLWEVLASPVYQSNEAALYDLDRTAGGSNLQVGDIYVKSNVDESTSKLGTFKIYRRVTSGATVIKSAKVAAQISSGIHEFTIQETLANSQTFTTAVTVPFIATGAAADADVLAGAINSAGLVNVTADVDAQNKVSIRHKLGGEIRIVDTDGELTAVGFTPYLASSPQTTTANLYYTPGTTGSTSPASYTASNWQVLSYVASADEPLSLTADGELWYSSVIDEVDIMIHNGSNWVGYQNFSNDYADTDPAGPIVSATEPTDQSDGTSLVEGDLWIDSSDIENFPTVWRYNATLLKFVQLDTTDQTTENGVLFADARWGSDGVNSSEADIVDLLTSDYLDPDAPDPALYPKGMLLWNLRRSGFNVKRFERNYINVAGSNERYNDESMEAYYPHRWVTDSGNNEDGSGTFGRHAQRKSVIQALQAMVNSNQDIRDDESRQFNLIACPGYPELIGEMITLNYDRRLSGFVVGDTPARLTPDATSLNEWASNVRLAVEDNDDGAVSIDEYLAMYYGWGFTSDNSGNNVVVPPSHMALRTILLNDQVAFPWFAPAGTRRGGVTNATASGYITSEGEFQSVALNAGQRDTLYENSINPITFINGAGLVVFGQKTRARNASALDRINVARLVVYMRVQLERLARPYLFEPNDKITRDQIKSAADAFCLELVSLRALYDFLTVCDESNNTPARIDRNELWLDIAIEPVKAIEFIYIPLRIKNTGEIASLG